MYALLVCRFSPVPGRSASTRTPTSIDVFQTALTDAQNVTRSPRFTGSLNVIRSTPAVTTRRCACRIAASPAASSHIFITTPPCTKPAVLLSSMPIQRTSTDREADAGVGSTGGNVAGLWAPANVNGGIEGAGQIASRVREAANHRN